MSENADFGQPVQNERDECVFVDSMKKLRACIRCHLIKSESQFKKDGCDNCLYFKEKSYTYSDYTSANFEGLVSIMDPQISWVARHMNVHRYIPGSYCVRILDELKNEDIEMFKQNNINLAKQW